MTTLVIHPEDSTTAFLSVIYEGRGWTVLTNPRTPTGELKRQIKAHDRIVMLGHGSEYGLMTKVPFRLIVDSDLVYLLREKLCVCIWCNADVFFRQYELKGFFTGMIVSEYDEALMYSLYPFSSADIAESNKLFAEAITKGIESESFLTEAKGIYYSNENAIIKFNQDNLYEVL